MKAKLFILMLFAFFIFGCEKEIQNEKNFYDLEYRIGIWYNPYEKDTLEFESSSKLIKYGNITNEEYHYRIENEILIISSMDLKYSTYHQIKSAKGKEVTLGNMAFTTGFTDNTRVFLKK